MNTKSKFSPRTIFWILFLTAALAAAVSFIPGVGPREKGGPIPVGDQEPIRILFGGDIFLDRSIRRQIEANNNDSAYPWRNIEEFLKSFKYKAANLEGPVWNRPDAAPTGSFNFAFQEEYVMKLQDLGFTHLSLANNHALNQGQKALNHSREFLTAQRVEPFGDPNNEIEFSFTILEVGPREQGGPTSENFRLAIVGENSLVKTNQEKILKLISDLQSKGNFVIVYPHWGPEYVLEIPKIEQDRAHALIDAGADLIIGSHPHVIQPVEVYKDRVIFYSLGNLLFDQGFSKDTMRGFLVEIVFYRSDLESSGRSDLESGTSDVGNLEFILHPTEQNKDFQISLASEETKIEIFERLSKTSKVPDELRKDILKGKFSTGANYVK